MEIVQTSQVSPGGGNVKANKRSVVEDWRTRDFPFMVEGLLERVV